MDRKLGKNTTAGVTQIWTINVGHMKNCLSANLPFSSTACHFLKGLFIFYVEPQCLDDGAQRYTGLKIVKISDRPLKVKGHLRLLLQYGAAFIFRREYELDFESESPIFPLSTSDAIMAMDNNESIKIFAQIQHQCGVLTHVLGDYCDDNDVCCILDNGMLKLSATLLEIKAPFMLQAVNNGELVLHGLSICDWKIVTDFLQTGLLELDSTRQCLMTLEVASKYQMKDLFNESVKYLYTMSNKEDVYSIEYFAVLNSSQVAFDVAKRILKICNKSVYQTPEWKKLVSTFSTEMDFLRTEAMEENSRENGTWSESVEDLSD